MSNKPFDLEKALAGEPCYLKEEPDVKCYALKQFGNHIVFYSEDVECWLHPLDNLEDFLMWQEPRPRVQLDLPAPLKSLEGLNEVYCPILDEDSIGCVFSRVLIFGKNIFQDIRVQGQLDHGNLFATKEDAEEWLDAMRNARK